MYVRYRWQLELRYITIFLGNFGPGPPASVTVDEQVVVNNQVYVRLSWQPPIDGSVCQYKLLLLPDSDTLSPIERRIDVVSIYGLFRHLKKTRYCLSWWL